jgi:ABC-type uncharacterized transport system substrate-binding protein
MAVLVDANFTNAAKLDALQEAARAYRVFNSSSREGEEIAAAIDSAQASVKLFGGSKVANIPVEQATNFELVINLKTTNAMGVTVPPALVARTDKVIE